MLVLTSFFFCTDGIKLNTSTKDVTLKEFESATMAFFVRAPDLVKKRKQKANLNGSLSLDSDVGRDDDAS
jgi:hypothetical protein